MEDLVLLHFGTPKYGWLPVDFHYLSFHESFEASDALNDPVKELYEAVNEPQCYECRRITWYFEPGAIFFDISKTKHNVILTITETDNLHDETDTGRVLIKIIAGEEQIIKQFRVAVEQFYSYTYEEEHWPFAKDNA